MQTSLIEELFDIIERKGQIEDSDFIELSNKLKIHRNQIYSVISFYKEFSQQNQKDVIYVCFGTSCVEKGSKALYEELKRNGYNIKTSYCFKKCAQSPVVKKGDDFILKASLDKINSHLQKSDSKNSENNMKQQGSGSNSRFKVYSNFEKIKVKRCIAGNCFHHKIHYDEDYFDIENCGCLGFCGLAPVVMINGKVLSVNQSLVDQIKKNPALVDKLNSYEYRRDGKIITKYNDVVDPLNIDTYISVGGYEGLKRAFSMKKADIINAVKDAGIRGKGGAAFPMYIKLKGVSEQVSAQKYVVANLEEGEVASFCNVNLAESNPFAIVEGMTISAYVVGASKGYIFVNCKAKEAIDRLKNAIEQAKQKGFLGEILSDFHFDIEVRRSPSSYVAGEETAMLEVIEGKRAIPRNRPPFPFQVGLFGKPTLINNVETFANLPYVLLYGSGEFAKYGKGKSIGTKMISLSGNVNNPCSVEVPYGLKIKDIIEIYGLGFRESNKGFLLGGPSGGVVDNSALEIFYTYEDIQNAGAMLGSGAIFAIAESISVPALVRDLMKFFADESCGQCVPCRVGTSKLTEMLEDLIHKHKNLDVKIQEIADTVTYASLCGLGQAAPVPLLTALKNFPHEFRC
ncbi:MAG: NAD(P)H-dependent oxidoreductase subunit E [Candidatus Calescibacterium sp.]|nr:NAD(P)H-dependent oxidoreductase subunit E [Candidatus Calescibacterium sp.]MCX7734048.1 NAD(P)H-dependent oxidoreductase subunit E [bacterium]MDW8087043.1 NADH-ubiquinone oxidoreductase-F iron-sulfur binding region domain-containing protein [Candidatus Calescibacterium sp.]